MIHQETQSGSRPLKDERQHSGAELTAAVCRSCAFKSQADQDAKGYPLEISYQTLNHG